MQCSTCGAALPEGAERCPICGHSAAEGGPTASPEAEAASSFFASVLADAEAEAVEEPPPPAALDAPVEQEAAPAPPQAESPPARKRPKVGLFLGVGLTAAALLIGLFFYLARTPIERNPVFWISGYQLLYAPCPGAAPITLQDNLSFSVDLALSEDQKTAYYFTGSFLYKADLQKLEAGKSGVTLIETGAVSPGSRSGGSAMGDINRIDGDTRENFFLPSGGNQVYYLQNVQGELLLRYYDGVSSTTIEEDIESALFSKDGSRLIYHRDHAAYLRDTASPDAQKIFPLENSPPYSNVGISLLYAEDDFSQFYYGDGLHGLLSLYLYQEGQPNLLAVQLKNVIIEDWTHYALIVNNEGRGFSLYSGQDGEITLISDQLCDSNVTYRDGLFLFNTYDPAFPDDLTRKYASCADNSGVLTQFPFAFSMSYIGLNGDLYFLKNDNRTLLWYSKAARYRQMEYITNAAQSILYASDADGSTPDQLLYINATGGRQVDLYAVQEGESSLLASGLDVDSSLALYRDGATVVGRGWNGYCSDDTYTSGQGGQGRTWAQVNTFSRLGGDRFLTLGDYESGAGRLFLCEGDKQTLIAENVSDFCCFGTDDPYLRV